MPRAKSAKSAGKTAAKATQKGATKSANKKIAKSSTKSGKKSGKLTVELVVKAYWRGNSKKLKLSKPFAPGGPGNARININHLVITEKNKGNVPEPDSLEKVAIKHRDKMSVELNGRVLEYAYTGAGKSTLIVWYYVVQPSTTVKQPSKRVKLGLGDLVVTIESSGTDYEGTDPDVTTVDP